MYIEYFHLFLYPLESLQPVESYWDNVEHLNSSFQISKKSIISLELNSIDLKG